MIKLISKNQDADKTGTDMLVKKEQILFDQRDFQRSV